MELSLVQFGEIYVFFIMVYWTRILLTMIGLFALIFLSRWAVQEITFQMARRRYRTQQVESE